MLGKLMRLTVLAVAVAVPSVSLGQSGPPGPPPDEGTGFAKVRVACSADAERLCKDVKAGRGHVRACLKAHEAELSDGCKAAIREAREQHHPHE